jgi:uncharacterized membrane protein YhaH (DUF805 family)
LGRESLWIGYAGWGGAAMKWIYFFGSFDGRIGRKTFWLTSIAISAAELVAGFVGALIIALVSGDWEAKAGHQWIDAVFLIFLYPQFIIDVKRGHDRNIPIWVIGVFYAALAADYFLVEFGWLTDLPNQNVPSSVNVVSFIVVILLGIFALAFLVELGFRKGTTGPNRYGPDPLGPQLLPPGG